MSAIDFVIIAILVVAVIVGIQRGLLASVGTLIGLALGGVAAYWVVPLVNAAIPGAAWRGPVVLAVGVGILVLGAVVGSMIGMALRRGVDRTKLRVFERILGGALTLVVAALAVSLAGQSIAATGMPGVAATVSSSRVLTAIADLTPRPIAATLAELRGVALAEGMPRLGELLAPQMQPTSPEVALDDPALTTAAQSVARVSGVAYACGISASGSGFVVAPDRVMTNAHVVAGVDRPVVELPGRAAREGRVVYFDPVDDIALIAVDDLDGAPLTVAPTLGVGSAAVVQGYPYGGPFTASTAQVLSVAPAQVPDIYDSSSSSRDVYALAAHVRPGNSGGPLLTTTGAVTGLVFARADNDDNVGYAMTMTELTPVLSQATDLDATVASGTCTA
ncbi:MAG TPA: MarP family serine protease [Microbacterium sp.]|uniref:MarP family serine protease n=1 Tax=Microbacterium sp. TaxID=51671 RepID=UPI002D0D060F|nr:MarP family serine protease [Microbacterium sp.]HWI30997.1 MarP family serine protease [Microbacterium sp.]